MPAPSEYTEGELRMFPIIISLKVPFGSQERIFAADMVYKTDFLIMKKLIVEVDGDSHESISRSTKDEQRDKILKDLGYPTVRFTDEETWETETCAEKIQAEIEHLPKVSGCFYSNQPHHHVPMMNRIWCRSARKYM
ncbi:MAG: hypothetical protein UT24_C0003G0041 [Candidatus Woesebacteria bacterium GW2011_GWB1_39_12]|uniref:DUF559 domain-containing protein n=1 Tax=Candidatus Woesebacteria bacterium GW2011_GWB1_39_12 TaxID=1618574 RepID=A0A0G0MC78_9BACT|nr:MAG: hypothetical protein UT24_C0003G0041 [Candidatus Woesebacteria bacterium GW2011_GWB1_39_12]